MSFSDLVAGSHIDTPSGLAVVVLPPMAREDLQTETLEALTREPDLARGLDRIGVRLVVAPGESVQFFELVDLRRALP